MRAARIFELGGPLVVDDIEEPSPQPGQVVVELAAGGINPVDVATSSGGHYSGVPDVPYTAGSEGVGTVVAGDGIARGTLVYAGRAPAGTLAERFLAAVDETWPLPAGTDPAVAVALGIAGLAGWLPLAYRARLQPGERVLVLGATGSVGRISVQAARLLGASFVVGAGRDADALATLRDHGADEVVQLSGGDAAAALREAFGERGPDVVVDPLFGPPLRAALDVAAPHARVVQLGQSAGGEQALASAPIRGKALSLLGHSNRRVPVEVRRAAHVAMVEHARAGQLRLDVQPYPLARASEAWEAVRAHPSGKPVVVP